jgi:cyclopropane fatty-acyl-phospholipid synthase-like methyltransferase
MKPYSESCEQNRAPILDVLRRELAGRRRLLEVGSGTGQHAVYFAPEFPDLDWQTSDVVEMHAGIRCWLEEARPANVLPPLALDVCRDPWPQTRYDALFSANTAHIMSWSQVECLFAGAGRVLEPGGVFCLYGPFNYDGHFTSESNARFDQWLKARDPASGVRAFEAVNALAESAGLRLKQDYEMPVNNRILVWIKAPDG